MNVHDLIHFETDDACAMCGERNISFLTEHHIEGKSQSYDNRILLCYNCHQSHHEKGTPSLNQIRDRKRHLIRKIITMYGLNAMKIASRGKKDGVAAHHFLLYHLVDMEFMKKTSWLLKVGPGDRVEALSLFVITPKGEDLLEKWFG